MRLQVLEAGKWTVTAPQEVDGNGDYQCILIDSFNDLGANYSKSLIGMLSLLEKFSEHGQRMLNDDICHEADKNEKLFEFIKGDLRLLWFYGQGNKIIVCSHCFVKKGRKTPKAEKAIAIKFRETYEKLTEQKIEIPLIFEKKAS
ncbi:type II toxin-antitoxin system RelE/ParE family toxin [Pseudomonas capsici]|uniref:type II toxin-antitoxin system RelE/ParE family toxin n=1 Tax=Pseudomonas capsici TaxID=2810614 RepID=UPI0021F2375F|nr:type II toxin-antitoxin system RelE/ParE family toxin [Pseudomonas capsici]MCV4341078.1 type II toxin-antitoxin system RelE/ParE family toxin [Pseudomonas capsici]